MSNFICSECGMTNIDCGYDGYKTPKEIELEKKVHILNEANIKLENELGHFADLSKKVERLQEQLKEANEVIKKYAYPKSVCKSIIENQEVWEVIAYTEPKEGLDYLKKWSVK